MATAEITDLKSYCVDVAARSKRAAAELVCASTRQKNAWLRRGAELLREHEAELITANALDLAAAPQFGLTEAQIDRLRLTPKTVASMAKGLDDIAALADPVGEVIESTVRPSGLEVRKVRVPLGVVFFIYESRPCPDRRRDLRTRDSCR